MATLDEVKQLVITISKDETLLNSILSAPDPETRRGIIEGTGLVTPGASLSQPELAQAFQTLLTPTSVEPLEGAAAEDAGEVVGAVAAAMAAAMAC